MQCESKSGQSKPKLSQFYFVTEYANRLTEEDVGLKLNSSLVWDALLTFIHGLNRILGKVLCFFSADFRGLLLHGQAAGSS